MTNTAQAAQTPLQVPLPTPCPAAKEAIQRAVGQLFTAAKLVVKSSHKHGLH